MARGAESKELITQKILETFEGSFKYDKEIRIPMLENGEIVQVKVTLTAAKVNVESGGDTVAPTSGGSVAATPQSLEITEEEKKETADLLESLGF